MNHEAEEPDWAARAIFGIMVSGVLGLVILAAFRDLDSVLIGILSLLMFAAAFRIGRQFFSSRNWSRPVALRTEPVPSHWGPIVLANFPLARDLAPQELERLLRLIQVFVAEKNIEGAGGLEVTDEIRVTIAAQACFLVLWLHVGLYPALRSVIVYPSAVVPKYARPRWVFGDVHDSPKAILGQSWGMGAVVLSWDSAKHGAFDPRDGQNVVFHEFAHQLDQESGDADGIPVGIQLSAVKPWAEMLERRFGELAKAERKGHKTVLDQYGAKNKAEFFAVATETFLEKPRQLQARESELYELLVQFYGVDPVARLNHAGKQ